jgi:hypothetical protein
LYVMVCCNHRVHDCTYRRNQVVLHPDGFEHAGARDRG